MRSTEHDARSSFSALLLAAIALLSLLSPFAIAEKGASGVETMATGVEITGNTHCGDAMMSEKGALGGRRHALPGQFHQPVRRHALFAQQTQHHGAG